MSYRKFDDPALSSNDEARKLYQAFPNEAQRRALQSVLNRIIWGGTGGTDATAMIAGLGTGSTGGIRFANRLAVVINGVHGTAFARDNMETPSGTQSANTFVKYLVSTGFGTSGTVHAGNEGATATAAKLPDCPNNHVAIGYMEYATTAGNAWVRTNKAVTGDSAATSGTVNTWVNLIHMPLDET